jgi:hydroxyethylthiazole kinase
MVYDILERVRREKPLVHHITNWVTIYDCANITRTCGALPVMAHAIEESGEMALIASALVLNIGTLTPAIIESMKAAGRSANGKGIPVVLDAVGVGATTLRNEKAAELLDTIRIAIVKGNASEIAKLAGENVVTKGVEAAEVKADLLTTAQTMARARNLTVVVTGKEDIVTDGATAYLVRNGHAMMSSIVGTGCMAASVIGAFASVECDYPLAAASALVCFGIAGELAAPRSQGPGTFKEHFFDALYNLDRETIDRMARVEKRKL